MIDDKALQRRLTKAKANRDQWRGLLEEAYRFVVPSREDFSHTEQGDEDNDHIFDETAPLAAPRYANRMQRSLFPDEFVLFKAGADVGEDEKQGLDDQLEMYTKKFYEYFNKSNFESEINPAFIDSSISTGVIQIEEEPITSDLLYSFNCVPINEIAFEPPVKGELVNMWRMKKVVAEQIKTTWPKAKIPQGLQRIIDKESLRDVPIDIGQIKEGNKFSVYIMWEGSTLLRDEFDTQRMIAFRLNAFPGETYGRGPGILVLPAIKDVNVIQELIIKNAAINVAGMYTARTDGIFNPYTFTIAAGAIVPVGSNDSANPTLSRLPAAGELGTGQIIIENLQDSIRKAFFVDPLGEISDPVRSATEQTMRMQEFLKDQGAGIGRIRTELVEKVVLACVDIARSRGKLPDIKVDGKEVKIEHNTALVQAEKQDDFQALMTWVQSVQASMPMPELTALTIKVEELPNGMAEMLNIPSKYVREPELVRGFVEQIAGAAGGAQNDIPTGG